MNDYNYPSSTVCARSSYHLTNFLQPIAIKLYLWLWQGICILQQNYLSNDIIKVNYFDKSLFNERLESLKEQLQQQSLHNFGKSLCDHAGKLITLGLAAQLVVAQASGANVTQQIETGSSNQSNLLDTLEKVNHTFMNNTTFDFILPTSVNKSAQGTVDFKNKEYTNNTEIFTLPHNSSAGSDFDKSIEVEQELKQKILDHFDKINDALRELIENISAEKNNELLEAEFSQTLLIRSYSPFIPRQECPISKAKLVELKNTAQATLSNVDTQSGDSNCELNSANTDNCDELLKLIQCGVTHLQNGFIKAAGNKVSSNELIKWKNAYDNLSQKYSKELDDIKKQGAQKYEQKISELLTRIQTLYNSISTLKKQLYTNTALLCASEIDRGNIEFAVRKYKELNDFDNYDLLNDIVDKAYTNTPHNFNNTIGFIELLTWFSNRVWGYQAVYKLTEKPSSKMCVLAQRVERLMNSNYLYKFEKAYIPILDDLKNKAYNSC